jgi:hypothetical protein
MPWLQIAPDFASEGDGKAVPYGVYDLAANADWVSVGTDHDTARWDRLLAAMHAAAGEPPPIHLSLADQALITVLRLRFGTAPDALASLYAVSASTLKTAQDHAWPLLVHAGYPTEPAGPKLKTLPELTAYAQEHGIALTPKKHGLFYATPLLSGGRHICRETGVIMGAA